MFFLVFIELMMILISSSNNYYKFWDGYKFIVSYSIRPITNTYKLGLIGFLLALIKIIENHKTPKYLLLCIFIILLWIESLNNYFKEILKKAFSIFLILSFTSIPFDKLKFIKFSFIKQISRYTGGIYYIYTFVNSLLKNIFRLYLIQEICLCA